MPRILKANPEEMPPRNNRGLKSLDHGWQTRFKDRGMFVKKTEGPRTVTLPDGAILTVADLPPPETRWVASRKETVVAAVRHGLITREDALRRYGLSEEEFEAWRKAVETHGRAALKVTALQRFRQP
ncbi:MAG: CtrA inhibitor SciP [Paracoccus sp. (in: a-proteobacteria)]|jgi:hypothetical protein|uniref:CtrA inhibitor SciP n=2 Tax=Paracoccus TaxID=265 RepID=UPI0039C8D412|tara:strand:+ start:64 stop:444 length:381 start_codon:yes stop_codon:yes gene_type:complete